MDVDYTKLLQLYIGCSGWSYTSWQGPFYPSNLENKQWLSYYSQIFNYVEIDSTFYRIPNEFTVKNWAKKTPENFRFSAKFPKVITHDKKFKDVEKELSSFYDAMKPLKDKLLSLLIQLPPYLKIKEGLEALKQYDFFFDDNFRYTIEVRHPSWFSDLAYNFLFNNKICMAWNQLDKIQSPPVVTSDFVYLRLIGDRSIREEEFGKIQKDRQQEMKYWSDRFRTVEENEKHVKTGIVAANNHYAGFGAATANMFRLMRGLPSVEWGTQKQIDNVSELQYPGEKFTYRTAKQKTMLDYTSN